MSRSRSHGRGDLHGESHADVRRILERGLVDTPQRSCDLFTHYVGALPPADRSENGTYAAKTMGAAGPQSDASGIRGEIAPSPYSSVDVVTNPRPWHEIQRLIGEDLRGSTISYQHLKRIEGVSFNGEQLYAVWK